MNIVVSIQCQSILPMNLTIRWGIDIHKWCEVVVDSISKVASTPLPSNTYQIALLIYLFQDERGVPQIVGRVAFSSRWLLVYYKLIFFLVAYVQVVFMCSITYVAYDFIKVELSKVPNTSTTSAGQASVSWKVFLTLGVFRIKLKRLFSFVPKTRMFYFHICSLFIQNLHKMISLNPIVRLIPNMGIVTVRIS